MAWQPEGHRRIGCPENCWESMITIFCRLKRLPSWEVVAVDADFWSCMLPQFRGFNLLNVL